MPRRAELFDLQRLMLQLESDRDKSQDDLNQRDHHIGQQCSHSSPLQRLLFWLDQVAPDNGEAPADWLWHLLQIVALLSGFAAMAGLLLASARGLVNVLVLLALFVVLQVLMSLLAALLLWRSSQGRIRGRVNGPFSWFARRRLLAEAYPPISLAMLQLQVMRYSQRFALAFSTAVLMAFVLLPAVNDFSFVWGSTFAISDTVVSSIVRVLSFPWSDFWPEATVSPSLVADSRYHPGLFELDRPGVERLRGWWPFLFMCLLVYAVLPRVCLWLSASVLCRRRLRSALLDHPGAALVLERMQAPLVDTQGEPQPEPPLRPQCNGAAPSPPAASDGKRLLVDWQGALGDEPFAAFPELARLAPGKVLCLGLGALESDMQALDSALGGATLQVVLAVKSWEPPMAELADLLRERLRGASLLLCLVPLPGRDVPQRKVEDWRVFAGALGLADWRLQVLCPGESS